MDSKESQTTELKSDWRDDHLKVISAFANSDGGQIILGLNDRGQAVGLTNAKKLLEDIPNKIRNRLGIIPHVEFAEESDHEIIRISVPPSSVPISYNGKFYLRSGSTVQELKGKDLADFLIKKSGMTWDETVDDRADFNSVDEKTIESFKKYASDRIPSIVADTDMKTILQKLHLIDNQKLKRATILLFGVEPQSLYSHACVKIGHFLTDTDIQTTDVIGGNLFHQLENTLEILRTKYLRSNIHFEGFHRRDILEYPYEALREAIINALIHRDYLSFSQIQIRVYTDKLVIMNAGKLPPEVPLEKLKSSHLSMPRNRLLASIFYYAGFIESWGRGTTMIVEKCVEQGLPEPDFDEQNGVMAVVFYKDVWNLENLKKAGLHERQIRAVMYVKEYGRITNMEYQKLVSVSKATASRDLSVLVKQGYFIQQGETGKGTFYQLKGS